MAISVFPAPVTSSINANSVTATTANTLYEGRVALEPAIYQITCASGTVANVQFLASSTSLITTSTTSSGTVTLNLGSTADRIRVWTNTGSNIVVTITKLANALTNQFTGTLDTITTVGNSTYTGTSTSGFAYVVLGGAGGGGGGGQAATGATGIAGGGGGVAHGIITLTGSMAVTIGAGGTAGPAWNGGSANGGNGGASTFGGMTANGGQGGGGGTTTNSGGAGGTATGGTINNTGSNGGGGAGVNAGVGSSAWPFVVASLGTGGNSPYSNSLSGTAGTGYTAGGGAGGGIGGSGPAGGAGAPGVLYVLRF
jgi:hypothetical protein